MNFFKESFLNRYNPNQTLDKAIASAIGAAVQHNSLYRPGARPKDKMAVRCEWRKYLQSLIELYNKDSYCTDQNYEHDIENLKSLMNEKFARIFYDENHPKFRTDPGFRVSHAQKSIAVFLKHSWCMGLVNTPPQCPVDRIILSASGKQYPDTKWGYVNTIEEHRIKVGYLLEAVQRDNENSLAEWELKKFNPIGP